MDKKYRQEPYRIKVIFVDLIGIQIKAISVYSSRSFAKTWKFFTSEDFSTIFYGGIKFDLATLAELVKLRRSLRHFYELRKQGRSRMVSRMILNSQHINGQ